MIRKLIRCTACNQVTPDYRGNEAMQGESLPGVEWSKADVAGFKKFLQTHSGHPLEDLFVETGSCISEKPVLEPLKDTYFLAGSAQRKFLVRRRKTALGQPASYALVPGDLKVSVVSLTIQEKDLRKEIAAERGFSPGLKRKMAKFIEALRAETEGISPEDFPAEAEAFEEGETSLIAYGSLSESRWKKILGRCGRYFTDPELKAIRRFIDENRNPPDVLSILARRRISILFPPQVEPGKKRGKK